MDLRSWDNLKTLSDGKNIPLQYEDQGNRYLIWFSEGVITYSAFVQITDPRNEDQIQFEDNYRDDANKPIVPSDIDNRAFVRSGSRKFEWNTNFTNFADKIDAPQVIYGGKQIMWDFSNSTDDITPPSGYKKKRITVQFIDSIQIKEGTVYFLNAPFGSFVEFSVVCPAGEYYYKNDGTLAQATEDTITMTFVKAGMMGDCPMGDEFNGEEASDVIAPNYKFWVDITTPDVEGYTNFKGHILAEINRKRSVILE